MNTPRIPKIRAALLIAAAISASPVLAERADRQKPVHLEADRISIDDLKKIQILEGNVILTQGTMQLRAEKIVVTQDASGFQRGVATSGADGLAYYREKREGTDEYIEGKAERIVYDAKTEKTEFFKRAWVKSGGDDVRGDYISYDALTEQYAVNSDPAAPINSKSKRVSAVIQPKNKTPEKDNKTEPVKLRPQTTIQIDPK